MKKQHRYKSGSIAQSPVRGKRRLPGKMRHSFVHRSDFKSLVQESKEMVQKELMRLRNFNLSDEGIVDIKGNPNMRQKVIVWILKNKDSQKDIVKKLIELCNDMPFYEEILNKYLGYKTKKIINDFFQGANYEHFQKNKMLFKQGDPSNNKCYVIIKGKVLVLRENPFAKFKSLQDSTHSSESESEEKKKEKSKKKKPKKIDLEQAAKLKKLENTSLEYLNPESAKIAKKHGTPLAILHDGSMFGQYALLDDKPRNASIMTLTECEFMIFNQKDINYIKGAFKKELSIKKRFLSGIIVAIDAIKEEKKAQEFIQFFESMNFQKVEKFQKTRILAVPLHKLEKLQDHYLTKEGESGQYAYLISQGSCLVKKNVTIGDGVATMNKSVAVCKVGKGTIVGEEILFNQEYSYSVICLSSELKVFSFEKTSGMRNYQKYILLSGLFEKFEEKDRRRKEYIMRLMDRMPHLIISRGKVSKEYMKKKQLEDRELMKANPLSEFNIKRNESVYHVLKNEEGFTCSETLKKFYAKHKRFQSSHSLIKAQSLRRVRSTEDLNKDNFAKVISFYAKNKPEVFKMIKSDFMEFELPSERVDVDDDPNYTVEIDKVLSNRQMDLGLSPETLKHAKAHIYPYSVFEEDILKNIRKQKFVEIYTETNRATQKRKLMERLQNFKLKKAVRVKHVKVNRFKLIKNKLEANQKLMFEEDEAQNSPQSDEKIAKNFKKNQQKSPKKLKPTPSIIDENAEFKVEKVHIEGMEDTASPRIKEYLLVNFEQKNSYREKGAIAKRAKKTKKFRREMGKSQGYSNFGEKNLGYKNRLFASAENSRDYSSGRTSGRLCSGLTSKHYRQHSQKFVEMSSANIDLQTSKMRSSEGFNPFFRHTVHSRYKKRANSGFKSSSVSKRLISTGKGGRSKVESTALPIELDSIPKPSQVSRKGIIHSSNFWDHHNKRRNSNGLSGYIKINSFTKNNARRTKRGKNGEKGEESQDEKTGAKMLDFASSGDDGDNNTHFSGVKASTQSLQRKKEKIFDNQKINKILRGSQKSQQNKNNRALNRLGSANVSTSKLIQSSTAEGTFGRIVPQKPTSKLPSSIKSSSLRKNSGQRPSINRSKRFNSGKFDPIARHIGYGSGVRFTRKESRKSAGYKKPPTAHQRKQSDRDKDIFVDSGGESAGGLTGSGYTKPSISSRQNHLKNFNLYRLPKTNAFRKVLN